MTGNRFENHNNWDKITTCVQRLSENSRLCDVDKKIISCEWKNNFHFNNETLISLRLYSDRHKASTVLFSGCKLLSQNLKRV